MMRSATVLFVVAILLGSVPIGAAFGATLGAKAPPLDVEVWLQGAPFEYTKGQLTVIDLWGPNERALQANPGTLNALLGKPHSPQIVAITLVDADAMRSYLEQKPAGGPRYPVARDRARSITEALFAATSDRRLSESCFIVNGEGKLVWFGSAGEVAAALAQMRSGEYQIESFLRLRKDRRRTEELVKQYLDQIAAGASEEAIAPTVDALFEIGKRHPEALVGLSRIILIAPALRHRDVKLAIRAAKQAWEKSGGSDVRAGLFYGKALHLDGQLESAEGVLAKALEHADRTHRRAIEMELGAVRKAREASDAEKAPHKTPDKTP